MTIEGIAKEFAVSTDAAFIGLSILMSAIIIALSMPSETRTSMLENRLLKINEKLANLVQAIKAQTAVQRNRK